MTLVGIVPPFLLSRQLYFVISCYSVSNNYFLYIEHSRTRNKEINTCSRLNSNYLLIISVNTFHFGSRGGPVLSQDNLFWKLPSPLRFTLATFLYIDVLIKRNCINFGTCKNWWHFAIEILRKVTWGLRIVYLNYRQQLNWCKNVQERSKVVERWHWAKQQCLQPTRLYKNGK